MSCYLVLRVGARGCALSHLILQPTRHRDLSKTSTAQRTGCPRGDPSSKEDPRGTRSQTCSTCTDFSEPEWPISAPPPPTPSFCPLTSPTHPTNPSRCSASAEREATPALGQPPSRSATGRQKRRVSAPVQTCRGPGAATSTHVTSPGTCLYSWENVEKYL